MCCWWLLPTWPPGIVTSSPGAVTAPPAFPPPFSLATCPTPSRFVPSLPMMTRAPAASFDEGERGLWVG
ncbi:uncharacterized protein QC763_201235 [Podospora pseudopauciseta]|uniref:Secreted protein n=1 Tax=Podospora pseudopauciseta TaxID=2093780 RepID=A0ABR0HME3_9PEZI|nr:hypothetical protein QC763_201235 [Podospora pseudopauciseta]